VGEAVVELLAPVRERYLELRADEAALESTLAGGADHARSIATGVMADVRSVMGVGPRV
jgi:tryptophanyl-tRNA synthetase